MDEQTDTGIPEQAVNNSVNIKRAPVVVSGPDVIQPTGDPITDWHAITVQETMLTVDDVRRVKGSIDLSMWHPPPKPWMIAYAIRLTDPSESRSKGAILRELHVTRTRAWSVEQKPAFQDLKNQLIAGYRDASHSEIWKKLLQVCLTGDIKAMELYFKLTGELDTSRNRGADFETSDLDPLEGLSASDLILLIHEQVANHRAKIYEQVSNG